ncbi:MAG: hypothetical protein H7062_20455 [Candidatus Saccharimonas sp.]|nr:hypothetical protein [Planctomycetaceae bacterium]
MTRRELLDLYFLEARARLIDLAAFLDRVERAGGTADFRLGSLLDALRELDRPGADRAPRVLLALSDRSSEPIETAPDKGACGACPPATRTRHSALP